MNRRAFLATLASITGCALAQEPQVRLYGFYSAKAVERGCGTSFYSTFDGGEVEVTAVQKDRDSKPDNWDDRQFVGEVKQWLRRGRLPSERASPQEPIEKHPHGIQKPALKTLPLIA